jgi:hypothetical protein
MCAAKRLRAALLCTHCAVPVGTLGTGIILANRNGITHYILHTSTLTRTRWKHLTSRNHKKSWNYRRDPSRFKKLVPSSERCASALALRCYLNCNTFVGPTLNLLSIRGIQDLRQPSRANSQLVINFISKDQDLLCQDRFCTSLYLRTLPNTHTHTSLSILRI